MNTSLIENEIMKGNLHFIPSGNGYVCREMLEMPERFAATVSTEAVNKAIQEHQTANKRMFQLKYANREERDAVPEEERRRLGEAVFDEVLASISTDGMSLFHQLLFWLSDWWYYHPILRTRCTFGSDDWHCLGKSIDKILQGVVIANLPEQVRENVFGMKAVTTAVGFGHFAILFASQSNHIRRIVTDTELFEIHDVYGYTYLDITKEGKPVARSVTSRGGERAFFDGVRLMSHNDFCTCAPKTSVFEGGYKVNSTGCTIVNGILFPVIESEDAVAKTTGAFMGMCDFSTAEALQSYALSEQTSTRLKVEGRKVYLDGAELKPIGMFLDSEVQLLDTGFALYGWSEFVEDHTCRYDLVMVVDDNQDWLNRFRREFGTEISDLNLLNVKTREKALDSIMAVAPQVLVLDMHLSDTEGFDGLWIANQLFENGFGGKILIASSYPDEQLNAMRKLIKGRVWAPGKNLGRIRKLLSSSELN